MTGTGPEHLYERIAGALRDEILAGTRAAGSRLPTQEALTEAFGASRMAVRRALDLLESEGLIDRVRGGRATVRRYEPLVRRSSRHYQTNPGMPFADEAVAAAQSPRYDYETSREPAGLDIARRLQIGVGDEVVRTRYVSYASGRPVMQVTSYEPAALTAGTPIELPEEGPLKAAGIVDRFTSIGLRPTRVVEQLESRMPRPSEAAALHLRPGTPVVAITRISHCADTVLETANLLLAANQYRLEYVIPVGPLPGPESGTAEKEPDPARTLAPGPDSTVGTSSSAATGSG
jgi:DNA-binding GntR family transcriptional regulator